MARRYIKHIAYEYIQPFVGYWQTFLKRLIQMHYHIYAMILINQQCHKSTKNNMCPMFLCSFHAYSGLPDTSIQIKKTLTLLKLQFSEDS